MNLFNSKKRLFKVIILIVLIVVCFGVIKSKAFKDYYNTYQWEKNRISNQNLQVYSKLDTLRIGDYIQFENIEGFKAKKAYNYARVIEVTNDSVMIAPFNFMTSIKLRDIDRHYFREKENLKVVKLSRKDLADGVCDNYIPLIGFTFCGIQLLDSEEKLRLSSINNANEPVIRFSDLDVKDSGKFYISFYNVGQPIYMQNIKASHDSISFFQKHKFPYFIGKKDSKNSHFAVAGNGWDKSLDISIEFTVKVDTLSSKTYTYRLSTQGESTNKFEHIY